MIIGKYDPSWNLYDPARQIVLTSSGPSILGLQRFLIIHVDDFQLLRFLVRTTSIDMLDTVKTVAPTYISNSRASINGPFPLIMGPRVAYHKQFRF